MATRLINSKENKYKSSQQLQNNSSRPTFHFSTISDPGEPAAGRARISTVRGVRHTERGQMSAFPHLTQMLKGVSLGCFKPLAPELDAE